MTADPGDGCDPEHAQRDPVLPARRPTFAAEAHVGSLKAYQLALWDAGQATTREAFWAEHGDGMIDWSSSIWTEGPRLEAAPRPAGSSDATVNASYNCVDRHANGASQG